jgi:ribosomal protein S18 acetylase RimI-like enzyme
MKIHLGNKMISIQKNTEDSYTSIRRIAEEVWPVAYGAILSNEQLDYMMEMMYSVSALQKQATENNHHFILAIDEEVPVGFASYEFNNNETDKTKIHKIYILTSQQSKGIGKQLIDFIAIAAKKNGQSALFLNVNKYNVAQHFYKKLGFTISCEEVIAIGNGYIMDDYVMEKLL